MGGSELMLRHTFYDAFATLKERGMTRDMIREALMDQNVELVLTAHPTQALRRTVLQKLNTYDYCICS